MPHTMKTGLPLIAAIALAAPLAHAAPPATHAGHAAAAPQAVVTTLMEKDLPDIPGKDALMIVVDYPPGAVDPVHRHDAYSLVYVLEGSIVMQVQGGKEVTLTPGQTFYEDPHDIHTVGRNASQTQPAKFLVIQIKKEGAPILTPLH